MSLKSFPKSHSQRQVLLFLDESAILDISNNAEKSNDLDILEDPSVLIIPLTISDRLKNKHPALSTIMDEHKNLRSGDLLILDQGQIVESRSGYLPISKVIDSFIDRSYELACAYSSFFAALGATRVFIEHKQEQSNAKKHKAEVKADGIVANITGVDMDFIESTEKKISETMRLDDRYTKNKKTLAERIKDAEKILYDKNLEKTQDANTS